MTCISAHRNWVKRITTDATPVAIGSVIEGSDSITVNHYWGTQPFVQIRDNLTRQIVYPEIDFSDDSRIKLRSSVELDNDRLSLLAAVPDQILNVDMDTTSVLAGHGFAGTEILVQVHLSKVSGWTNGRASILHITAIVFWRCGRIYGCLDHWLWRFWRLMAIRTLVMGRIAFLPSLNRRRKIILCRYGRLATSDDRLRLR